MVEMATVNGAHVAQVEDRTGSLTVGKQGRRPGSRPGLDRF
jgi:imidazolonepropionase-like amidohydrolase